MLIWNEKLETCSSELISGYRYENSVSAQLVVWLSIVAPILCPLQSCYNKCVIIFLGYRKHYSVTTMLLKLRLPSFRTVQLNSASVLRCVSCVLSARIVLYSFYLSVCCRSFLLFLVPASLLLLSVCYYGPRVAWNKTWLTGSIRLDNNLLIDCIAYSTMRSAVKPLSFNTQH